MAGKVTKLLIACIMLLSLVSGVSFSSASTVEPRPIDREATATGTGGAAASLDPRATEVAIEILRKGGNAIDATIGAAAMLGLVRPYDGSIGGDGYMTIYLADERRTVTIDSRSMSPAKFDVQSFRKLTTRQGRAQSIGVPGLVRGWELALNEFGTMDFSKVLAPAIAEAEGGFLVDQAYRDRTSSNRTKFLDFTSSREYYLTEDLGVPEVGDIVYNPDLAKTYRMIAEGGADAFYKGPIAEAIVAEVTNPSVAEGRNPDVRPSTMDLEDLASYSALLREPTRHRYRGYEIVGVGGSSTGGATVGEMLNIMQGLEANSHEDVWHNYIEASRLAFADRATYIGTSPNWEGAVRVADAPLDGVLSKPFAAHRRQLIGYDAIQGAVPHGDPFAYDRNKSGSADLSKYPGEDPPYTSTTHLTVSDRHGNVVSYTFTIVSIGGSGISVPGYGFLLNDVLIGSVPPPDPGELGGRPYSNTAPTIVFKGQRPVMALGGPGSAQIIAAVSQILVRHIDLGMDLKEALAAPRLSSTSPGLTTSAERAFFEAEPDLFEALRNRGHQFSEIGTISNANGIQFFKDGRVEAVAEPVRLGGGAAAVENPE